MFYSNTACFKSERRSSFGGETRGMQIYTYLKKNRFNQTVAQLSRYHR